VKRRAALVADEDADQSAAERPERGECAGEQRNPLHQAEPDREKERRERQEQEQEADERPRAEAIAASPGTDA